MLGMPLLGIASSVVLLGEPITWPLVLGTVLVIAGIAIVILERAKMNWGMMSRAERDAAYNNTDAVKNSAELNAARDAASAAFRQAHPEHLDLPLRAAGAQQLGPVPGRRSQRALPGLHPWRLLAAQQPRACSPA